MNRKSVLAVVVCLVLVIGVALPGTLAVSADQDSTTAELSITDEAVTPAPEETPEAGDEATPVPEETPEASPSDLSSTEEETEVPIATPSDAEKPDGESAVTEETPSDAGEAAEIAHTEDCSESCTGEDCKCSCHTLFERLMACKTLEELLTLIDETPEEDLILLSDSEVAEVEAKIVALEPEPLPAVVINASTEEPVISEIVYPTVNIDEVAPLGDPVIG